MSKLEKMKDLLDAERPGRTLLLGRIFTPKPKDFGEVVDRLVLAVIYFGGAWVMMSITFSSL